ncbi:hypothetical protein D3C86_1186800 [compost metagenome]
MVEAVAVMETIAIAVVDMETTVEVETEEVTKPYNILNQKLPIGSFFYAQKALRYYIPVDNLNRYFRLKKLIFVNYIF